MIKWLIKWSKNQSHAGAREAPQNLAGLAGMILKKSQRKAAVARLAIWGINAIKRTLCCIAASCRLTAGLALEGFTPHSTQILHRAGISDWRLHQPRPNISYPTLHKCPSCSEPGPWARVRFVGLHRLKSPASLVIPTVSPRYRSCFVGWTTACVWKVLTLPRSIWRPVL